VIFFWPLQVDEPDIMGWSSEISGWPGGFRSMRSIFYLWRSGSFSKLLEEKRRWN